MTSREIAQSLVGKSAVEIEIALLSIHQQGARTMRAAAAKIPESNYHIRRIMELQLPDASLHIDR